MPEPLSPEFKEIINTLRAQNPTPPVTKLETKIVELPADPTANEPVSTFSNTATLPSITPQRLVESPITDADKDRFEMAILKDEPFIETFSFYNGKLKVALRTRTMAEIEDAGRQLEKENPRLKMSADMALHTYQIALALCQITINGQQGLTNVDTGTLEERLKRIRQLSYPKFMLISEALTAFDRKVEKLRELAKPENF